MSDERRVDSGYTPIADYGAIGNLRTVALISKLGSVDWCCFPDLDSPSAFGALLDARRGGRFLVTADHARHNTQRYLDGTNMLETRFDADQGRLVVTDFMPVEGPLVGIPAEPRAAEIQRLLVCEQGDVEVTVEWSPQFDYARGMTRLELTAGGAVARGAARMALGGLPVAGQIHDGAVRARFRMRAGDAVALVSRFHSEDARFDVATCRSALEATRNSWLGWVHLCERGAECGVPGPWHDQSVRSGLALKLLTHAHTGGLAAAATTSLPEEIGGARNWDYRFTWVRDAAFTVQALYALGHRTEAENFLKWLRKATRGKGTQPFGLQVMYGLHGETEMPEIELGHLEGYRGSRPVRIGNAASLQRQLDIYGELIGAAYEVLRWGASLDEGMWSFLSAVVDLAAASWREPDHGIWEVRGPPRHFVYSKLMVWVALDRAIHLANHFRMPGDTARWTRARAEVRAAILDQGYDQKLGAFVQSFGSHALDAANLLIPMYGLLPFDDPRVQGTIDRTVERLTGKGLVYRYLTDDGVPGGEGGFGLTTFWLSDVLALSGRHADAEEYFESMARRANHLGLYSEEFDPTTGAFLGNFPQAFTHTGFVNSALYLARARGEKPAAPAPMGTREHQAEAGHRIG
ncbi:MAG: glycoside hydrolase family 15 protein [Gemmatimonadales bacterium]